MPDDVVYETREDRAERSVEELKALLKQNNALLTEFGPSVKAFVDAMREGRGPKRGVVDYLGSALLAGKFDAVIEDVRQVLRPVVEETVRNPPRRRRRQR